MYTNNNSAILKIKIDATTLDLMEKATQYLQVEQDIFIQESIQWMAQNVITEQEATQLSEEDWQMFFAMQGNPSPPTERIRKAAQKYHEIVSEDEV